MTTKRGKTNKKRTYTKRQGTRKSSSRARTDNREQLDYALKSEILLIVIFAVAVFLFLCNFRVCGNFGNAISDVMFGLFGITAYVFPVALLGASAVLISNFSSPAAIRKVISGIVLIVLAGILSELFMQRIDADTVYDALSIFDTCKAERNGGGLIAGSLTYVLFKNLSMAGTLIVVLVLGVISIVIFTEKSVINGVKKRGKKVWEKTAHEAEEYREYAQQMRLEFDEKRHKREEERLMELEQKEDEKILRMDKKISGVMLDTQLKAEDDYDEDGDNDYDDTDLDDISYDDAKIFVPDREEIHDDIHEIVINRGLQTDVEADGQRVIRTGPVIHSYEPDDYDEQPDASAHTYSATEEIHDIHAVNNNEYSDYNSDSEYDNEDYKDSDSYDDLEFDMGDDSDTGMEDATDNRPKARPSARVSDVSDLYDIPIHREDEDEPATEYNGEYKVHTQEHIHSNRPSQSIDNRNTNPDLVEERIKMGVSPKDAAVSNTDQNEMEQEIKKSKKIPKKYVFPPLNLLNKGTKNKNVDSARTLKETAMKLQNTLKTFGVNVTVTDISQGPAVTRYELQPEAGVKISKIVGLSDDIKMNLAATDIRIEAPIPGKAAVGIEVPNKENSMVALRDLLSSDEFRNFNSNLAFAVGKDIAGKVVVADLGKMPHLLIAGATGSGKSVCINTLIMSLIYKSTPEQVRMILIDPKVVELSVYNGIPHLLIPVVTDPKKAAAALNWAVVEMNKRYKKFADAGVRDMKGYNAYVESTHDDTLEKMPQIVVIVDELADLMMVSSNEVEESICRLTQLARAAGIHLIIATQRPSVDVITGLIKANMPSRIAFAVSSGVDSRTILDTYGAEKLLGKGDMLFAPQGYPKPARVQGAFVSDKEVQDITDFLKKQMDSDDEVYNDEIQQHIDSVSVGGPSAGIGGGGSDRDEYFAEAGSFIIDKDKASIGMLQRAFKIGFNRAARIMDQLCEAGVVGEEEGTKPRKILMTKEEFAAMLNDN